jgi:dihydropteroate synthase
MILDCAGKPLDLSRPTVMGVLNVTPDSFSDGGRFASRDAAVDRALCMVEEGAGIIDVGGESTRPGAPEVSVAEELERVIPVLEALCPGLSVPVSIDTRKPEVMAAAVAAGAGLINDVNALRAPGALEAAVAAGVPVCLMHMQGEPRTMQEAPDYGDVVEEVRGFLLARAGACEAAGIPSARILLDPGFGFGKALGHNLRLLRELDRLTSAGYPVLVGLSRKSMIGKVLGLETERRLHPSLALAVLAVWQGARLVRAHDIRATVEAIGMCAAVLNTDSGDWD